MNEQFAASGNGTAFVRELDKCIAALPPWSYGLDQVWDGYADYRYIRIALGQTLRDGEPSFLAGHGDGNKPFVVELFGEFFGFAAVQGGWLVVHIGGRAYLGNVYIGLVDILFSSVVTEAQYTREVPDITSRAIAVVAHEQTEETRLDAEYLGMCLFLLKKFVRGEHSHEQIEKFVRDYIDAIGG